MLMMTEKKQELGLELLAVIKASALSVAIPFLLEGPIPATEKVLKDSSSIEDVDVSRLTKHSLRLFCPGPRPLSRLK